MNTREKLRELIDQYYIQNFAPTNRKLTDHLIANGVTVQEWISVKDRLPEEYGWYLVVTNGEVLAAKRDPFLFRDIWNCDGTGGFAIIKDDEVTHWMPMPPAPKLGNKPDHQLAECSPQTEEGE